MLSNLQARQQRTKSSSLHALRSPFLPKLSMLAAVCPEELPTLHAPKNPFPSRPGFSRSKQLWMSCDQGWYMLPVARKVTLFKNYDLDATAWPHLYKSCKQSHFLDVWTKMFPEIRLRKHCRFAKCGFCVEMRELQTSGTFCQYAVLTLITNNLWLCCLSPPLMMSSFTA